eukprot:13272035-Alexandrium_andersonii.AAC.1
MTDHRINGRDLQPALPPMDRQRRRDWVAFRFGGRRAALDSNDEDCAACDWFLFREWTWVE